MSKNKSHHKEKSSQLKEMKKKNNKSRNGIQTPTMSGKSIRKARSSTAQKATNNS